MILVISYPNDYHTKVVLAELDKLNVAVSLLDLSQFPQHMQVEAQYDSNGQHNYFLHLSDSTQLDLTMCSAIWWRRAQPFLLHPEIQNPTNYAFAYSETSEAFSGLWLSLDAFWVNHPTRDADSHHKLHQLRIAQEVGLTIPETLITNNPDRALEFVKRYESEGTIYKAFTGTQEAWRETRLLKENELALIDSVRYAPVIFQRYVEAQFDLRITVVGEDIFPAAIFSQESSYKIDFRMDMSNTKITAHQLPSDVEERLHALMQRLGIIYGAIDMRLTPTGQYVFLEVNPAGQWLFVEEKSGQPISKCLAHLLATHANDSQRIYDKTLFKQTNHQIKAQPPDR